MSSTTKSKVSWPPLESNPDLLNLYLYSLGAPSNVELVDIYSLDSETFSFYPNDIIAIIVLFPLGDEKDGKVTFGDNKLSQLGFFVPQTVGNACGTMALLHAVLNRLDLIELRSGALKDFYEQTKELSYQERAKLLETFHPIGDAHIQYAMQGQTEALDSETKVDLHYTTFLPIEDKLVEFDGRNEGPVDHGECQGKQQLLPKVAEVVKRFIDNHPQSSQFSLIGLSIKS